jgi:hypothetical protein
MLTILERISDDTEGLPLFDGFCAVPRMRHRRAARRFLRYLLLNRYIQEILDRIPQLGVQAWLTSGCLVQTAWNLQARRPAHKGIDDYDLIYYDPDVSWDKEDAVIRQTSKVLEHLPVYVQIRNQARVPLWYHDKFSIDYPPVRTAQHALLRFPSRTSAIAVTRLCSGELAFYAPFGFRDALQGHIRPNQRLSLERVYMAKVGKWQQKWPALTAEPWAHNYPTLDGHPA